MTGQNDLCGQNDRGGQNDLCGQNDRGGQNERRTGNAP